MNNLERTRKEKGMTQVKLAAKAGVGQGMISAYENGVIPTLLIALRIARVLDVRVDFLWTDESLKSDSAA